MAGIPEHDWRVLRDLREVALERFCERVLRELGSISSAKEVSWHQRYLDVFALLNRQDDELARAFNFNSRSKAIFQLAQIHSHGLLTQQELERFTPATLAEVEVLSKLGKPSP
ncbi:MAG: peptide ABC transporter substrate-binding protein [Proteobacteria bacterium]|nr:peptide ABC transporter substrate-binding protein [Pseudomonadota bacterium]